MKKVTIPEELSNYVERLFYERNSVMSIIRFLSQQEGTKEEYLQYYMKQLQEADKALNVVKDQTASSFVPEEYAEKYTYEFDFLTNSINYFNGDSNND